MYHHHTVIKPARSGLGSELGLGLYHYHTVIKPGYDNVRLMQEWAIPDVNLEFDQFHDF